MRDTEGTADLNWWVGPVALLTALVLLAAERTGGAQIPPDEESETLGAACITAEVITDCNDDYWCIRVNVGAPPDPTKCSAGNCGLACTASTGTYQDVTTSGNQSAQKTTGEWNCGKQYVALPACAYSVAVSRCKCSTSGTASSTDCRWPKYVFTNCSGGS